MDKALLQKLLATSDEMYFKALLNRITGFANVRTLKPIHCLYTTYGCITPGDLTENNKCIWALYDPSLPIKTLINHIEGAVDLAVSMNAPYTPSMVVSTAYETVLSTGLFYDACRDWRRRPAI